MMLSAEDKKRFWSHVKIDRTPGACWEWDYGKVGGGYGRFVISGQGYVASRLSWELANGPIPDGLMCLHHCDNPPCVNPSHLYVGTAADNTRDMCNRGRFKRRGEGVSTCVLITRHAMRALKRQAAMYKRRVGAQATWLIEQEHEKRRIAAAVGKTG